MTLSGTNFIGFSSSSKGKETLKAFSPVMNEYLPEQFSIASREELESAVALSDKAFISFKEFSGPKKATFLDAIASEIISLGEILIERCVAESGLSTGRITGERARTCYQLQMFAQLLRDGWYMDARIDTAQPERQPAPKPDIRRMLMPIGPVAVFGASNFPLAFSTAGGDTASALAAGCPVIVKAHPSHPGTNELVSSAIVKAAQKTGMPEGVFSSLYLSNEDAVKLVQDIHIKAVGFTGSRNAGMTLFNAAMQRTDPIPVYAEMSSVNPVILMENALSTQGDKIAKALAASVTLGAGQFCTNPGLVFVIESQATQSFLVAFSKQMNAALPETMLNKNVYKAYAKGIEGVQNSKGIVELAKASQEASAKRHEVQAAAFRINAMEFCSDKKLAAEVFGPASLIVLCKNTAELHQALQSLEGQLTATVHATAADEQDLLPVINIITQKAGRIIYGGFPTGVEVCHAMQHGGPFPSTTDSRSTSVGTAAIYRFVRPVAFQDFPDHLLPEALKNENSLHIQRLINGNWTTDPI